MATYQRLVNDEINSIDAAVFSGDVFLNAENRADFREWMSRWERALAEYDTFEVLEDE
jgi:hypothetical protein